MHFSFIKINLWKDCWKVIISSAGTGFLPPRGVCILMNLNLQCGESVLKDTAHFAGRVSAPVLQAILFALP